MNIIKELEQRIDFIILNRYTGLDVLESILENPDDSNGTKIEKALAEIAEIKNLEKEVITDDDKHYAGKGYMTVDDWKLQELQRIISENWSVNRWKLNKNKKENPQN